MATVRTLSSHPDLHTVSSSVPMIYSHDYPSHEDHTVSIFDQCATANTLLGNSCYETTPKCLHNFRGFINGGFYSPDCERINHTQLDKLDKEKTSEEERKNKNIKITRDIKNSYEILDSPCKIEKDVTFVEIVRKTSAPTLIRPQTLIKLMRAKGQSDSHILTQENRAGIEESTNSNPDYNMDGKLMYASTQNVSQKRGGYFSKVSALFKRKSSNSLSKLASQSFEEITHHIAFKMSSTRLNTSESHDWIHEICPTNEPKRSSIEDNLVPDLKEDINGTSSSSNADDKLERSYSKLEIEQKDSTNVNVMRMPSLRRRKVNIRLFYHFNAARSSGAGVQDVHVIKDATHVQSLDSGEAVVTDILSNSMILFDHEGHPKVTFSMESGSEPWSLCLTPEGCWAVTLKRQGCVSLWTQYGEPVSEFGHNVLLGPTGIQCDHQGRFIVADEEANSVFVFSMCGEFVTKLEESKDENETEVKTLPQRKNSGPSSPCFPKSFFKQPRYVCITNSGNYVITDSGNHSVKIFDKDFNFRGQFGSYGRRDGNFKFPYGVACDAENNLYIADHFNNRVSLFSPEGEFIEHLLTLEDGISRPKSLAVHHCLLYVTHGGTRSSKVSVFKLNKQL